MQFKNLRNECLQANHELVSNGLVDLTFGNASVFDPDEKVFAIKPSGVDYSILKAADMVVLDLEGNVVSGKLKPSSDSPTHRCLYLAFEQLGVRGIAHTHSRNAVSFAQAARSIACLGTTHADFFNGSVPVTRLMSQEEVEGDYEWETGKVIIEAFEEIDPLEIPAVLVNGHGPFSWGASGAEAVEHAFALEVVAEMAMKALALNPGAVGIPDYLLKKHFFRKHGADAYYGQDDDA